ncbi:MAG TPA: two-component regulator propeller domain-containing protein [Anaerolineales bacterium]|nr:two-component regulator propeller domain-containing protein [Anaerolineales bacterium]
MKRKLILFCGLLLAFGLASCGGSATPIDSAQGQPETISASTSLSPTPSPISPGFLPQVCNCALRFEHIGIEQGLSQSSVQIVFQDSRGFLWFGTQDGLNRYDGYAFKIYKPDPDVPASLSDRWITSIVEDKDGYLWIGTRLGGLNYYDPHTDQFTHFMHDNKDSSSLGDNHVNVLYKDKDNNLWIGTENGLDSFVAQTNSFRHYPYNAARPNSLSGKRVTVIYQDANSRFWIGTLDGGLNSFNPQTGVFTSYQYETNNPNAIGNNPGPTIEESANGVPNSISNNHVTAIEEDANGVLWVGTKDGLNQFNRHTGEFTQFLHNDHNPASLSDNGVNALYTDKTGNLWVATDSGLDRLSRGGVTFFHYYNDPSFSRSLSNGPILSIFEDKGGVLWFGTSSSGVDKYDRQRDQFAYYRSDPKNANSLSGNSVFPILVDQEGNAWIGTDGRGLNHFNRLTKQFVRYYHDPNNVNSLSSDRLVALYEDHLGYIWIGTANGLDRFDPKKNVFTHYKRDPEIPDSLGGNFIYTIYEDRQQQLWIGTASSLDLFDRDTGVFTHYRPEASNPNSISGVQITSILEDNQGYLWVGTFESGLNRFDPDEKKFKQYHLDLNNKKSLSSDSILSIYQDKKGRLWIGTAGGGLNLYHPDTESFTYYLEKDGLPNGVVYGILEDDHTGNLWLSTNFGLSRFDPESKTSRNFDMGDGLQSNEFNMNAYAKSSGGEFYFGGVNGLTVFYPSAINDSPYLPEVTLTSLTQGDHPITTDSSVETTRNVILQWPQNSLEFEFAALSYNQPNKNQYAYKLEGFDSTWHFIGTKRDGRYTNLSGGQYTLLLKASNSDGVWNPTPVRVNVTVIPPFWQTLWFRVLLGVIAVVAIAGGFGLRTKTIQDRNRALERLVRERTSALEKRNQEIQALYKADERILRNVSLNQVFQTLVDVAVEMLNADRSVVFAWDEKQTKMVPRVSHGFSAKTLEVMEFAKGEGIVGEVMATGKPAIVRQIELNGFRPEVRAAIIAEGIRSFVHLPIMVDHKVVGVFNVGFNTPNLIGDDTTRLFSALTHRAAITIANMELFEQTKDLAVMEERNRLARDLHDSAKQKAFAALAQLGTARGILNGHGNSVTMHLNEAENLVTDVIQELTFLVQEIYPLALQEKGLVTTLREHIFEWENRNDTTIQLSIHNERRLSLEIEQALYRITQEALANVARHSHAQRVDVSLLYNGDSVQLSVSDDGCGFDVSTKHGMGLRSIRERVSSIRGTVQIQSAPGQGTRLLVQVPAKS